MTGRPSAQACTNCRDRKVRCEITPGHSVCRNCKVRGEDSSCYTTKSRRGGKRKVGIADSLTKTTSFTSPRSGDRPNDIKHPDMPDLGDSNHRTLSECAIQTKIATILRKMLSTDTDIDGSEHLAFDEYYTTFHKSHPFLLPSEGLLHFLEDSDCPELLNSILSVGYRLLPAQNLARAEFHCIIADAAIVRYQEHGPQSTLINVQLLLLQALLKFACNDRLSSAQLLSTACDLALMGTIYHAAQNVDYETADEVGQSTIRTLWEIWMSDIMFAALKGEIHGTCQLSAKDLGLSAPLHEYSPSCLHGARAFSYRAAQIETTSSEFNILRALVSSENQAYHKLIAAFDLLREVIQLINVPSAMERAEFQLRLDVLDSKLLLIRSSLPPVLSNAFQVDYINFRTHMVSRKIVQHIPNKLTWKVIASETIMLHAQDAQAQLPYFIQSPACGLNFHAAVDVPNTSSTLSLRRLLLAANDLVALVKSIDSPRQASPQLCCALSLSSFVHASANLLQGGETSAISLQLEHMWLQELSRYWPTASCLADKVTSMISSFALFGVTHGSMSTFQRESIILDAAALSGLSSNLRWTKQSTQSPGDL